MKDTRYFFSYAREDSEVVLKLAKELRALGANLWLDQLDILGGQRWDRAVETALESCEGMITCLSPESLASDNVMDEVSYALEERKLVVPILLRSCTIPFRLRRVQYIDFTASYATGVSHLLRALHIDHAPQPLESAERAEPQFESISVAGSTIPKDMPGRPKRHATKAGFERLSPEASSLSVSVADLNTDIASTIDTGVPNDTLTPVSARPHAASPMPEVLAAPRRHGRTPQDHKATGDDSADIGNVHVWQWIDRLLPIGTIVLAWVVFCIVTEPTDFWSYIGPAVTITAFLCPLGAAIVCATGVESSKRRRAIVALALVSFTAPFISLYNIRDGIVASGSTELVATAAGLFQTLLGAPFVAAAGLALAVVVLPRRPLARYRTMIISFGAAAVVCMLVCALEIRVVHSFAFTGSGGMTFPRLSSWIIRALSP